jgi:hypothetical protein
MAMSNDDELVSDYLRRLNGAASGLPADRRHELVEEITAHIAEARAASPGQPGDVRTILDQLGAPEEIVRAATEGTAAAGVAQVRRSDQLSTLEVVAVVLVLVGGVVLPFVGWLAGVILLWASPRWQVKDKLLATLVWPGGLLAPLLVYFALTVPASFIVGSPTIPPWLAVTLLLAALAVSIAGPIWVTIRLVRRSSRPAVSAAERDQGLLASSLPA